MISNNAVLRAGARAFRNARPRTLAFVAWFGVLAFVRVFVLTRSVGSNDIHIWYRFAGLVADHGVPWMYPHVKAPNLFNHPPLMAYWARAALWLSNGTWTRFPIIFKLPWVAADIASGLLLHRIWLDRGGPARATRALALYAVGLTGILISAHHGNTDALCAFLCLLAAYYGERGRHFSAGVSLGAALNVKLIPMLVVPAMILGRRPKRGTLHAIAGLAIWIVPYVPLLWLCRHDAYANLLGYKPDPDNWGVFFLAGELAQIPHLGSAVSAFGRWYLVDGRNVLLGAVVLAAVWGRVSRNVSQYQVFAVVFALFLLLSPGFGVQYTVYLAPVLFAVDLKKGVQYSTFAGIFIGLAYLSYWSGRYPADTNFTAPFSVPVAIVGLAPWSIAGLVGLRLVCESDVDATIHRMMAWRPRGRR
ncbi:MAG: glycosyltransferase family 87 protein [Polyangiaceae bacterium]